MIDFVPASVKLAIGIGICILIGLGGSWVYNKIYDRGYEAASIKFKAEEAKMIKANQAAIASAEKDLREDIAKLSIDKEKLENESARLDVEADQDRAAHSCGIKRSGVRRLNAIR